MKKIWQSRERVTDDVLGQLLHNRGLRDSKAIEDFLDPKYEKSFNPSLLKDMDKAVLRIASAVSAREKITVYADYDADAVTAAAVLLRFFQAAGYSNVNYYIPDRNTEGYGVNPEAVQFLADRGTKLVITVDCGINAFDSVTLANYLGMDVVITDHHQLERGAVPEAIAVIDPHRPDDNYPFKDLTGVGVAFKLVQALVRKLEIENWKLKIAAGWEKWLLDLVAIGTVADCQSLLGENRIFVGWGMVVMGKTRWPGLRALFEVAGISKDKFDTYKIGFIIAPRINAAGRIEHANLALELLLTDDERAAARLAQKLNELNSRRQELTEQILSEAREQLGLLGNQKVLLAAGDGWPKGIVGLVASKLTEEFYRPVLILEKGEMEATGSARSIPSFNIVEAIGQSREILLKYGGHPMAAGFTLRNEHIEVFHKNLLAYADDILSDESLLPALYYEAEIFLRDLTEDFIAMLERFTPFGIGNPRPRFRINNLAPATVSTVSEGKHLRMSVESQNQKIGCIGFNLGFWKERLQAANPYIDIICEPQFNVWNGHKNIQLRVVDLKFSDGE
ncbi:MAG: single-stranded-DNA-specific exonuclease RecJ [bacterium]|nr:single-stranded-DNA-specific exonuclease RecJ [bacterium]